MAILLNREENGNSTFESLVKAFYAPLYKRAYFLAGSREQAEDIVQQAMLQAWRAFPRLKYQQGSLYAWFYRIVTNVAHDFKRSGKLREAYPLHPDLTSCELSLENADPFDRCSDLDLPTNVRSTLRTTLRTMLPHHRRIIALLSQGYQPAEIAQTLGYASMRDAYNAIKNARDAFRIRYRRYQEVAA